MVSCLCRCLVCKRVGPVYAGKVDSCKTGFPITISRQFGTVFRHTCLLLTGFACQLRSGQPLLIGRFRSSEMRNSQTPSSNPERSLRLFKFCRRDKLFQSFALSDCCLIAFETHMF